MAILKPSDRNSWSRKLSQRQSVRLPCAIVVPNGLSLFARSTSTWIHWWSPDTSANLSMSSWVTSRQSLGPMVCPTSAFSSSIPFTVVGVLMGCSISTVVIPGLRLESSPERLLAVGQQRPAVRDQHAVEVELEQRLQGRVEALAVEALDLGVDPVGGPDPQLAVGFHDGITEDESVVAGQVKRHLVTTGLADGVCRDAGRQRHARLDLAERGAVLEPLRRGPVAVDRGVRLSPVAAPELLRATRVVRDRDEDREAIGEGALDRLEHLRGLRRQQRVDQERRVARLRGEARHLGAELSGMPLRMARRPAPEAFRKLLHGASLTAQFI